MGNEQETAAWHMADIRSWLARRLKQKSKKVETLDPDPPRVQVRAAIQGVMDEAWHLRDTPGALERAQEIRKLAEDQLKADTYSVDGELHTSGDGHRRRIIHDLDEKGEENRIWIERSEEQLALEAGLRPFMDQLPGDDRALLRWTHDVRLTQREIAKLLHITQPGVLKRLKRIHERLRTELVKAFPVPEEDEGE